MNLLATPSRRRGTELLLRHCGALVPRPPVADRLSEELGGDLSRRLVRALAPGQRAGRRLLRGSSSP